MRVSARALGWYHLVAAVSGGAFTIWAWARGVPLFGNSLELAAMPFALTCGAGIELLRGRKRARPLAYLTQAMQIPMVILPALTWQFNAGVIVSLTLSAQGPYLFGGLAVGWLVGTGPLRGLPPTVGINLAPIAVLVLLARATFDARAPIDVASVPPAA